MSSGALITKGIVINLPLFGYHSSSASIPLYSSFVLHRLPSVVIWLMDEWMVLWKAICELPFVVLCLHDEESKEWGCVGVDGKRKQTKLCVIECAS